jgi:DNA-binding HxlR family transcriptional regulator
MTTRITLSAEIRTLIESRLEQTVNGIEDTLQKIVKKQKLNPEILEEELKDLEQSFKFLFQKWNLEIMYTHFLKGMMGFGEIKKILGVNSRTLSDKLKILTKHGYIQRDVVNGPPLRVNYSLTAKGKNTVLLALPLLYYTSSLENI